METRHNDFDFNLLDLLNYLKRKAIFILIAAATCALAGFLISSLFMTPQYTASTRVYVLNRSDGNAVVSSDFTLSNYMIADYKVLITGQNVTSEVIEELGLSMSPGGLAGKIAVSAPANTRVLQISVTDSNPEMAAVIANSVREVAARQLKEIMAVDAVNLVYEASVPTSPTSPNVMKNTVLVALLGAIAVTFIFAIVFILDDAIRTEEDVERYLGLNTLGVIPVSSDLATAGSRPQPARGRPVKK